MTVTHMPKEVEEIVTIFWVSRATSKENLQVQFPCGPVIQLKNDWWSQYTSLRSDWDIPTIVTTLQLTELLLYCNLSLINNIATQQQLFKSVLGLKVTLSARLHASFAFKHWESIFVKSCTVTPLIMVKVFNNLRALIIDCTVRREWGCFITSRQRWHFRGDSSF